MIALLIAISLGFLSFLFVANLYQVRFPQQPDVQRRLEGIKKTTTQATSSVLPEFIGLSDNFRFKFFSKYFRNFKITEYLKSQLTLAGMDMQIDTYAIISAMCTLPLLVVSIFTSAFVIPLALLCGLIPFVVVKIKIFKRNNLFAQQLPDALDLISNSLKAGHSLFASFEVIVTDMPTPINQVFKGTVDEISLGIDTKDAINNLTRLMPSSIDLKFFTTAVLLQREVGGNLAKVLDELSKTIRERFKMLGQLRAQTSQARLSGFILTLVPPIISLVLFIIAPDYMGVLLNTPTGHAALGAAALLLMLGIFCISKIMSIEL